LIERHSIERCIEHTSPNNHQHNANNKSHTGYEPGHFQLIAGKYNVEICKVISC